MGKPKMQWPVDWFDQLCKTVGPTLFTYKDPEAGPCPEEDILRAQAAVKTLEAMDPVVHQHLKLCGPCLDRYLKIRADNYFAAKRKAKGLLKAEQA